LAAEQGLHGFCAAQGLALAAFASRGTTHPLAAAAELAAQGLHGFAAAQGLIGFVAAHGLHGFFAAKGLQGAQADRAGRDATAVAIVTAAAPAVRTSAAGMSADANNVDLNGRIDSSRFLFHAVEHPGVRFREWN
jgi:hypothetical protein